MKQQDVLLSCLKKNKYNSPYKFQSQSKKQKNPNKISFESYLIQGCKYAQLSKMQYNPSCIVFNHFIINNIVMKTINTSHRHHIEHAAITQLMNTLKEINLNQSWKQNSTNLNKMKTTHLQKSPQQPNLMTEQDLDQLFQNSKEKIKVKTEATQQHRPSYRPTRRDFADVEFLRLSNDLDRMLTGLPQNEQQNKENMIQQTASYDLTAKFKKDYIIGKIIGQGAYASVRVAVFRPTNQKIAIKAYEKTKIREPARKKTVRREIKILQTVSHPNIVKIYDVVESNNHLNIIMQFVGGISLSHFLKQQPSQKFSQPLCRKIIQQLAAALSYLHNKQIAHRDIKLQNIILDEKHSPKLIDFGFSTCIEKHTKIKIFCGTPSYMAPEIVQKKEYRGEAADIWALGVMMFVMLMGYFPYKGSSDQQLYRKINKAQYPSHDITVLRKAHHLISKMFAVDADQRITASEILNHPWIRQRSPLEETDNLKKKNNCSGQLKKMLNLSKEKSCPREKESKERERESISKKKRPFQITNTKNLSKTHKNITISGKLVPHSSSRPNKLQKTAVQIREEKSPSNNKIAKDKRMKILDFLKLQLKRCSESMSPCKSYRP